MKHRLTYIKIARESGISRQQILRIRLGASPTIATATRIRDACRRLTKLKVRTSDVFDV